MLTWKMCSVKKGVKGAIIRVIKYSTENRDCRDWRHSSRPCSPCDRVRRGRGGEKCCCELNAGMEDVCGVFVPTLIRFLLNRTYQLVSWSMNLTSRGTTVYRRYTTREIYMNNYNYNPCHF